MSRTFICPQGHEWDPSTTGTPSRCPACGEAAQAPLPESAPQVPEYELYAEAGRDRLGTTYQARHLFSGRMVAFHWLDGEAFAGFHPLHATGSEAGPATRLNHPNIAPCVEAGDVDGNPYLATEWVAGETLQRRLRAGPLPARAAAELVRTLARAVQHAHKHGVLHGGLNPACVVLTPDGTPRITGFGMALFLRGRLPGNPDPVTTFPPDPSYASPEQLAGRNRAVGPATDVYSLGATLYAALTGCPPFLGATPEETAGLVVSQAPVPPRALRPGVPAELDFICRKCLEKNPARRYPSAEKLAEELDSFLAGKSASPARRGVDWVRRNPAVAALALACLLLLGAALAVGAVGARSLARARGESAEQRRLAGEHEQEVARAREREAKAQEEADEEVERAERAKADATRKREEAKTKAREAERARTEALRRRDEEEERRAAAEGRANSADEERRQAVARRREAALHLLRAHVASGARFLDAGDPNGALPWFAEALRLAREEKLPEEAHRLRLAAVLGQCARPTQVWAPDGGVTHVRLSPGGQRVLTAGKDGTASVWDVATGKQVGKEARHGAVVTEAVFAPDGKHVLTADERGAVRLWDMDEGKEVFEPVAHRGAVLALAFSAGGKRFLTLSRASPMDPTAAVAQVWDASTGEAVGEPLTNQVVDGPCALSPDGTRAVTCCADHCARLWDVSTGESVGSSLDHGGAIVAAEFSADGRYVLTAGGRSARLWDATTGKPHTAPLDHGARVVGAACGPGGKYVLTAGRDRAVRVWGARKGELIGRAVRFGAAVTHASFGPDGRHVLAADEDGVVRLTDVRSGEDVLPPLRHHGPVVYACFHPRGAGVLTFARGLVRLWDVTAGEPLAPPARADLAGAVVSPDGRRVVRVSGSVAQVHDLRSDKPVGSPLKHEQDVGLVVFSPDGRRVLTVSRPPEGSEKETPTWVARVWDAESGKQLGEAMEHLRAVPSASFSADGKRVLTVCADQRVRVWDAEKGARLGKPLEHRDDVVLAAFSPDGEHVLTSDAEGMTRAWKSATGERAGEGMGHAKRVLHLAFSADGKHVATSSEDGSARVWETTTGNAVTDWLRHDGPVVRSAFSPDGKFLVSASRDRTARVWSVATGSAATPPLPHRAPPSAVGFSADGKWVLTAAGNEARVWDRATGEPVSPPLRHCHEDRDVTLVTLDGEGKLVTADAAGVRWARDLRPDARPVSELVRLAQVLAGRRLSEEGGGTVPYEARDLRAAWAELEGKYGGEFSPPRARLLAWAARGAAECEARGLWAGAVLHLTRLVEESGGADLYVRRAHALAELGRWGAARADYAKALERYPERWELWAGKAGAEVRLGRWDEAVADYSKALEREDRRAELWAGRGRAEAGRGKWDRAAADLGRAVRLAPRELTLWRRHALALLSAGDAKGYRQACERLVKRFGRSDDPAVGRAVARVCTLAPGALGDLKPLVRRAEEAVRADPKSVADLRRLAFLLYRTGEHESTVKRAQEALALLGEGPAPREWLLLALAHHALGKPEEAKKWLAKAAGWLDESGEKLPWDEAAECRLWRREAEGAIKGKP
jgi:eukaryotic-like serine/threonine-protein kinase